MRLSKPQTEVLHIIARAETPLTYEEIRSRREVPEAPTATLDSLTRKGLVTHHVDRASATPATSFWLTDTWEITEAGAEVAA